MRKQLLTLLLLLVTFCTFAQSNLSVFSTNPDNSYVDGETLTWTVMITNNGPSPANNVHAFYAVPSFLLPIPPGVTKFSWFKGDGTGASGTNTPLNNTTAVLAVGETITYTLTIKVPNGYAGTIPSLQVSYMKSADIEVINTDNQTTYTPGTQVVYTVTVVNHGPEVADPVSIAMPIPAGITNFSWTGSNGSSGTNIALTNTIGLMAVNQPVVYTVTLDVPVTYSGNLTTQATITSPNTVDPVPGCTQCADTDTSLQDADVVVVNTNNQTTYVAGANSVYTVTVTNNGPASATNVVVSNAIPAGITAFSWTGSNGSSGTNVPLSDAIGTMALNQVVTYTITLGVPVGYAAPTLVSQAAVTSDKDANPACLQCVDTDINPVTAADLVVVNTNGQTVYTPGTQTTYTITVTNNGPGVATNVNVFNAMPAGIPVGFAGVTPNFFWTGTNGSVGVNIPVNNNLTTLPVGATITYTVVVQIPATFQGDLVSQTVVTSTNDPNTACTQCLDVDTSSTPTVNLVVTNTDNQELYTAGTNSVYTVTVTNSGPYTAANVVVNNPIPAGVTAFSWTGSNGSSGTNIALNNAIPTLAAGASVTYTITLGVPVGYTGNLTSVASATTTSTDPLLTNNTASDTDSDVLSADLVVTKTLNQGNSYTAGANLIYTITVNNQGPTLANNITVADAIPAGLNAAASSWTGSNGTAGTGNVADVIPTLGVGQTVTYTLTIPVPSNYNTLASITNQVVVTSGTPDPNPACPGCTHTATPNPQANLVTLKTNGQTTYLAGEQTVYTIMVTNPGPSDAVNVVVHDSKPFHINSMTWEGNGTGGSGTLHNVIPLLAAGQSMEYTVTIFVEPDHITTIGPLINTVTVTSSTPDPIPACPGCVDRDEPRLGYVTVDKFAYTTQELVLDVLIDTDCINVSAISASAGDINGSYGVAYFEKNNSTFPIKNGIVIRSGDTKLCEGKYNTPFPWVASSVASNLGDSDLFYLSQTIMGNAGSIQDVSYLKFDFVPLSTEMSFDFLFAANEYGTYQCGFFDVFGFLLKNVTNPSPILPGAPWDSNIAVIPGTSTPISVQTIRDQAYNAGCPSANITWFGQYNVTNVAASAINMNGQSKVMTAMATVIPGNTYTIKLAVGDYNDTAFDTAVFIAGGSFNIGQPELPEDLTLGKDNAVCPNETYLIEPVFPSSTPFIFNWEKDGVLILNPDNTPVTTSTYLVSEPGVYTLKAAFPSSPTCFITSDIRIEYRPDIEVAEPIDLVACGNPALTHFFDLKENDNIKDVLLDPDGYEIEYYHSMQEILDQDVMISYDPAIGYEGHNGEEIFIKVVGFSNICYTVKTFFLRIYDCEIEMDPYTAHVCEPAPYDDIETFDLTSYTDELTVVNPIPASYVYTYYNNQADAEAAVNSIANPTTYQGTSESVWVRVDDTSVTDVTTYGVEELTLIVTPQPIIAPIADVTRCDSYTLPVLTVGDYFTQPGGAGTLINPAVPLTASQIVYVYAIEGTAPYTCTNETSFNVTIYDSPVVEERADLEACDGYDLPPLTVGNYYASPGGTGPQLSGLITTSQTIYIYAVTGDATTVCEDESDFEVTINSAPIVSAATPLEECADNFDGHAYFDLTPAGTEILNGQSGLTVTYYPTQADADFETNAIPDPTDFYSSADIVYASVVQTGTTTNCRSIVPIQLLVQPRPANPVMTPYEQCDTAPIADGIEVFDLTTKNNQATAGDTTLTVAYYTNDVDAQAGTNPIATPTAYSNTTANQQTIWVSVVTGFGCRSIASFSLIVNPLPVLSNEPLDFIANECEEVPNLAEFHLDEIALAITDGAAGYSVAFYPTLAEALDGTGPQMPNLSLVGNSFIYARISDAATGCFTTAEVELRVIPAPIATPPAPIAECDTNLDHFEEFDLTPRMNAIVAALGNVTVTAHETPEDAEFGVNAIPNPSEYLSINADTQTLYIRVQSTLTECFDIVTLQLIVNPVPEATTPSDYALCDDGVSDTDGQATFDLSTKAGEIYGTIDPTLFSLDFYTTPGDAAAATNPIANPLSYLTASTTVYARVTNNATGCYDVVALNLIVNPLPVLITNQYVYRLCETEDPVEIETFDLTTTTPVFLADQNGIEVTYYHTFADANAYVNRITNDTAYQNNGSPGAETLFVRFTIEATGCYRIGFLDVDVDPEPIILVPTQDKLTVCDTNGQGIGEFNLDALIADMANGEPFLDITFHETLEDAQSGLNAITNTTNYTTLLTPQTIWVRVSNSRTGCVNNQPFAITLIVEPAPQAPALEDLTFCDDTDNNGQDGRRQVDLTVQNAVISAALGLTIPQQLTVEYYTSAAAAELGTGRIINPAAFMAVDGQQIWVRVEALVTECYSVEDFFLHFNKPHALTIPPIFSKCDEALPNDGITTFDLTTMDDVILGPSGVSQGYTVNYYEGDPKNGGTLIANPTAYTNPGPAAAKTLFVEVITTQGCKSYTTLTIKVLPLPVPNFAPTALSQCDDTDPAGTEPFNLTDAADEIAANGPNYILSYYATIADAEAGTNPIANPTAYESASGEVYVRVEFDTNNPLNEKCHQVVTLELILNPLPPVANLKDYTHCQEDTTQSFAFDIQTYVNDALGTTGNYDVDYFTDAALTTPAIPVNGYVVTGSATVYVRVVNLDTGCEIVKALILRVEQEAIANPVTQLPNECDYFGANDGITNTWDLTQVAAEVLGGQDPNVFIVTYHDTNADDAREGLNPIATPEAYTNLNANQTIWITVTNSSTQAPCRATTEMIIVTELLPVPVITGGTICVDKSTDAVVRPLEINTGLDGATHSFQWFHDNTLMPDTGASIVAQEEGSYTVIATSASGCVSDLAGPAIVLKSGPAVKVDRGYYVSNYFSDSQTITVTIDGYGNYEYSLDEGPWQTGNIFANVSPGSHTVRVRDTNADACDELVITDASIVDYPNFFTPNDDGFHDTWNIIGLANTGSVIYIFDRYGKLLKQVSPDDGGGWDGTFNGIDLPADDYWFTVTYPEYNGTTSITREFKSHFSLKR